MRSAIAFVCCFLILSGCEASFTTASLSEPAISEQVDSVSMAPVDPAETFMPTASTLNATIKLSNAPPDTTVTARFYLLGDEKKEIADQSTTTSGTGHINFSLDPPGSGWPIGTYQVDYYLGTEIKETITFYIKSTPEPVAEAAIEPEARPAAAPEADPLNTDEAVNPPVTENDREFKAFKDEQFGFSLELPSDWIFRVIGKKSDYLFTGAEGSEEGEILVIVQMIDTRKAKESSLKSEMGNLLTQFTKVNGAKIVKKDELPVGGLSAPFFLVTYPIEDSKGEVIPWGHTQLGLQNGPIILLISYAAPRDIYQRKIDIFQHMMDSVELSTPGS